MKIHLYETFSKKNLKQNKFLSQRKAFLSRHLRVAVKNVEFSRLSKMYLDKKKIVFPREFATFLSYELTTFLESTSVKFSFHTCKMQWKMSQEF